MRVAPVTAPTAFARMLAVLAWMAELEDPHPQRSANAHGLKYWRARPQSRSTKHTRTALSALLHESITSREPTRRRMMEGIHRIPLSNLNSGTQTLTAMKSPAIMVQLASLRKERCTEHRAGLLRLKNRASASSTPKHKVLIRHHRFRRRRRK